MSLDADLKSHVLAELEWEPSISAAHIGVAAHDGVITLSGHVEHFAEKHAAEAAARRVRGVKAVADGIEVKLPFDTQRSDEAIAAAAVDRLAWDTSVPEDAVKVTVEGGWVTLSGDVKWHFQHHAAEQDVHRLWGVVGVSNHIRITSPVNTIDLTARIDEALHRAWFDPKGVRVTAEGGRVTLTGTVESWTHRMLASATAWAAPGTTSVDNNLLIA